MSHIFNKFKQHASCASFHYADDSGKEWYLGNHEKGAALKLFDDNPDLQDDMCAFAKDQLWSLNSERPEK